MPVESGNFEKRVQERKRGEKGKKGGVLRGKGYLRRLLRSPAKNSRPNRVKE